ncbi:MAG TPA: ABC transporter permease [Burkholderiaceae bacterium]|nr:ABC transporter permease [Burkholderiaceae bacterium]
MTLQRTLFMYLTHPLFMRLVSFAVVLGAWEFAGSIGLSAAFPSFSETFVALWGMAADGSLFKAFGRTLEPLLMGLFISVAFGVGLGVWMGLKESAEWLFAPVFIVAQAAPLAALIPVLTFAYGIGLTAKVLTVCIMAMPVIVINALGAVRNTPASLIEMGKSFLGTRRQVIWNIVLPAASPMIFVGLRLGCASGFIGVILAELLITPTGIGDLISYNQSVAEYPSMYAAILSIIIASVLFIEGIEFVEKTLFRPEKRI